MDRHTTYYGLSWGEVILVIREDFWAIWFTRRYGSLCPPTSSSCGGLVAFCHLEGPSDPL